MREFLACYYGEYEYEYEYEYARVKRMYRVYKGLKLAILLLEPGFWVPPFLLTGS